MSPSREAGEAPLRVLVVDDNATDRWFFTEILRSRGYTVIACESAEDGMASLDDGSPDIVLLDLMLPGMNGTDMCRRLRAHPQGRDSFVVVVTGSDDRGDFDDVLEAGADDFIRKPLDAAAFFVRLDIAERRIRADRELHRAEFELAERTRELETLFKNVQDVFFSVDLTNGRLIQISPVAATLFGRSLGDITGEDGLWARLLDPALQAVGNQQDEARWDPIVVEYPIQRPSGGQRWLRASLQIHADSTSEITRADGVIVDVTRERSARTELRQKNEELEALYRLAETTLAAHGLEEGYAKILELVGEVMDCEVVAIEHLDADRDRLVLTATRGIPKGSEGPLTIPLHQTLSGVAIASGRPVLERDPGGRREHSSPVLRALELRSYAAFPLLAGGRVFGTLLLADKRALDLDAAFERLGSNLATTIATYVERIEAEDSLRRSEARHRRLVQQLQQANQELESFAYSVSHDLRAPLRTMQGFAHALLQNFGHLLPPDALDYANRIIASGQQSEVLIRDLLSYSRLSFEKMKLEPIDLSSVVAAAREQVAADLEEAGASLSVVEPLPSVSGNHTVLVQVVANLLSNAVKFVPEGTKPEVAVRSEDRDSHVRLWVEDNGIGVPAGQEERIFRVFERLSHGGNRPGTGIGLAVVRRGMQRIGGECGVQPKEGGGSAFWIDAPATTARTWRPSRRGRP